MSEKRNMIPQHEPLRVPNGWTGQARALVMQIERVFDDIFRRFRATDIPMSRDDSTTVAEAITDVSGKFGSARFTKTVDNGYFTLSATDVPTNNVVISGFYASGAQHNNYIYTPSAGSNGSVIVYVRDDTGQKPADNTSVQVNVIWCK